MKRLIPIILISFFFLNPAKSSASHLLGGEITWQCIKNGPDAGKFIFTMKLYRACSGIPLGSTASISNPFGSPIILSRTQQNDLSPTGCYNANIQFNCYGTLAQKINVMEENVYVSAPIQLNGTPSVKGSSFSYSVCCRPTNSLQNLSSAGFWLRSKMFPYTDPVTNQVLPLGSSGSASCYDSSPEFVAKPKSITCLESPANISMLSSDSEGDSLDYSWSNPMQDSISAVIWNAGYDSLNQFPTTFHHTNNLPATLNSSNGEINFTSFAPVGNYHQYCVKVSNYRDGQLISAVYRDVPIVLLSCNPPQINAPPIVEFKNAGSGTYKTVLDTAIQVGSYIELDIRSIDLDTLPLASPNNKQSITVEVVGEALSNKPNNSAACSSAPCAYLDTIGNIHWKGNLQEYVDTSEVNIKFKWYTTCDLLYSSAPYEGKPRSKKYRFTITSHDNYCPVPSEIVQVFYITVYDSVTTLTPIVNIDASQGGALVEWNEYKGPNFVSYQLMHGINGVQPYVQIAQTLSSADTSYLDQVARTDTVSHSYYVRVNNQIGCESFSNMIERSIYLEGVEAVQGVYLNWNRPTPVLTHAGNYTINRKLGTSNWTVLKNNQAYPAVFSERYSDFDQWQVIENFYRIDAMDSRGHASISNVALVERDTPSYWGIDEAYLPQVQFVPNPFKNELILIDENGQLQGEKLMVFNILGEQVKEFEVDVPRYQMDMRALKPGVYFVRYRDKNGILGSQRILKTE